MAEYFMLLDAQVEMTYDNLHLIMVTCRRNVMLLSRYLLF